MGRYRFEAKLDVVKMCERLANVQSRGRVDFTMNNARNAISRKMSFHLRHPGDAGNPNPIAQAVRDDGLVETHILMGIYRVSFHDMLAIVLAEQDVPRKQADGRMSNPKQRFEIFGFADRGTVHDWTDYARLTQWNTMVRSTQGHSLPQVVTAAVCGPAVTTELGRIHHGSFWNCLVGIMEHGLVPGGLPGLEGRGGRSNVYFSPYKAAHY